MSRDNEFNFEMAQTLRRSHCDRPGSEHECVGEMTIKRGTICLDCQLCGKGDHTPGFDSVIDQMLEEVFKQAGIDWNCLNLDDRIRAIQHYKRIKALT